ncbi:MAG: hypothetical protein A2293_10890 [Elusimicrobia bacterium RIFOXYB2_FULL_49_7]|nr:MAG: hypothetical protein A2293_10890 [Elusimicrobia bacterium RIFOXYB2_FULL_49_7]
MGYLDSHCGFHLKITDSTQLGIAVRDPDFQDVVVEYRKDVDEDRKTGMIIGTVIGSILGGLLFAVMMN